jgi:hypothetical protein
MPRNSIIVMIVKILTALCSINPLMAANYFN